MTQEEINAVASAIGQQLLICQKEILTADEAAAYAGLSKSALYKLTSTRQIPFSKPNGKNCFFRRTELEDWLMSCPVATEMDLNTAVMTYCMMNPANVRK